MKINRVNSSNKYPFRNNYRPRDILIVNHITEGSANSCISCFLNPKSEASTHFLVARDGTITQFMKLTDSAWGNGTTSNPNSNMYYKYSKNEIISKNSINANLFTVSIEHEGFYSQTKGALTELQYKSTLWLHKHIIKEIKRLYDIDIAIDRTHIIGHGEVSPKTRPNDPGELFPFDRLIKDLKGDNKMCQKEKRFNKIDELEAWAKPSIQKLVDKGVLKGDEQGNLNLSLDLIRLFVVHDRLGLYD